MRIDSIHLTNYRCHASLLVEFRSGFSVIAGVNGSGKTSLLRAICDALAVLPNFMSTRNAHYQALSEANVARVKTEVANGNYRFEPQYPVAIVATGVAFETACTWTTQKTSQASHANFSGQSPGHIWHEKQGHLAQPEGGDDPQHPLPMIAFYRANRHWNQPQPHEMRAATERISRTDGYASWWDASLDSNALQLWVIAKSLERLQISSESRTPFDEIGSDELALVNRALAMAVEGVKGLWYDLRQKSVLIEWVDTTDSRRDPTAFENLSDGQRAVIGLVADIARRMCVLNPQLGQAVTNETPGVVLVDELDIHLHPRWQRILINGLKRAFPKLQFIAASHSPQVLGELRPEEIILLRPSGTAHPQASYGLTSSQVLEQIMDADARTPEIDKLLSEVFELLERRDLEPAKAKIQALEDAAPGISELAGAQALLHRKEVLGR